MYPIKAKFQRLYEVALTDLLGATGVYVIWDNKAKARPTYIGEGNILKRFTDHVERDGRKFARPWDGYVWIIRGSTRNVRKAESKAVEKLLLDVAQLIDCKPSVNKHPGSSSAVLNYCQREKLRIAVSGYDPFLPPRRAKALVGTREIKASWDGDQGYAITHNWRLRRRRLPVTKRWWA